MQIYLLPTVLSGSVFVTAAPPQSPPAHEVTVIVEVVCVVTS